MAGEKEELVRSLAMLNVAVLSKLDGVDDYDLRHPLTPTGSNLLGIVKHLASVQAGYFGDCFGRPWPEPMPWLGPEADLNDDLFATASETTEWVRDFHRRSWAHAQETFATTAIDDRGDVPWWPDDRRHPTLGTVLVHMTVETARHAGHLDILREMIDGMAGRYVGDPSLPVDDEIDWKAYAAKVEQAAREAATADPTRGGSP